MTTQPTLPTVGSQVTIGKRTATIVRHGCATDWPDCPHGARAVTVLRDGGHGTECYDASDFEDPNHPRDNDGRCIFDCLEHYES